MATGPPNPPTGFIDEDGDGWPDDGIRGPSLPWDQDDPLVYWLTMWPNWTPTQGDLPTPATIADTASTMRQLALTVRRLQLQLVWTNTILTGLLAGDVTRVERSSRWRDRAGGDDAGVNPV